MGSEDFEPEKWSPITLMPAEVELPAASTWPLGSPRPVMELFAAVRRARERDGRDRHRRGELDVEQGHPEE